MHRLALLFCASLTALGGGSVHAQVQDSESGQTQPQAPEPIDIEHGDLARFEVNQAPQEVRTALTRVLEAHVQADQTELSLEGEIDRADDERRLRRIREQALTALMTEGYFTSKITASAAGDGGAARYVLKVELGPRATISSVDIVVSGALEEDAERRDALLAQWGLPVGAPFRDTVWSQAKTRLLVLIQDKDFAAAQLTDSSAQVHVGESASDPTHVALRVEIDSGPAFVYGEMTISGLNRYDPALVERFNPPQPGERYDATALIEFRQRLQSSPYFASAVVSMDPDPTQAQALPLRLELTEAHRKRVQFGVGYSTNTGPRVEATYRQTLLFGYPYTLQTGVGFDRTRSLFFSDILLPPKPNGAMDSVGALFEHTDIENVVTQRWGAGAARAYVRESEGASIETKIGLNLQREMRRFTDAPNVPSETNDVLSSTWTWTRRAVDDVTDPRRGNVLSVSLGAGVGRNIVESLSNNVFTRGYGRLTLYFPIPLLDPKRNIFIARGELGRVITDAPNIVPSEFLFRAGGAGSLRGYSYQSIGRPPGSTRAGSTALAIASLEAVHWFNDEWGAAVFVDVGDAADDFDLMKTPARSSGLGARWKTLAGPIALDAAWGERRPDGTGGRWRLNFSVAIAF